MKKIFVSLLFLVAAVASFAQIDSINYQARKMPFGNWDFIWTNGTLTDTVKVYPEKGGIGLDTLFFGDGTKQFTAFISDTGYVKTTGDSLWGTYTLGTTGSYLQYDNISLSSPSGDYGVNLYTDDTEATINLFGESPSNVSLQIRSSGFIFSRDDDGLNHFALNTMKIMNDSIPLADDASIILTNGISGWGEVYVFNAGAIDQWAEFIISSDGTVYLKSNSTDVVNTDTDNKLCIFDNGSGVTIRNRLGGARTIKYIIHH